MNLNETVLEMHFHHPIMSSIKQKLGLGKGSFNFYKYSPQRECFVGFDQAYVKSDLTEDELYRTLKNSVLKNGYNLSNFFIGLFLQFKVVKELQRRSRLTPPSISANPHYRASLDTKKNVNTGFSQHEILYNLNKNSGAWVYYACPMVFDKSDLYANKPDLTKLRLADVSSCPSIYSDNESHYIYFETPNTVPIWCSEPEEGRSITVEELASHLYQEIQIDEFSEQQHKLLDVLLAPAHELEEGKFLSLVSDSLLIIHYTEHE